MGPRLGLSVTGANPTPKVRFLRTSCRDCPVDWVFLGCSSPGAVARRSKIGTYMRPTPPGYALVLELVDMPVLEAGACNGRVGSSPTRRTAYLSE